MELRAKACKHRGMVTRTLFAFVLLASSACGGDDDGTASADAGVDAESIDAPVAACSTRAIAEDLGTINGITFSAIADNRGTPGGPITMRITGLIDRSAPPNPKDDTFSIRLFEGRGPFDPTFAVGTFPLTAADANFYTCATCLHITGDYDPGEDEVAQNFVADSGTLTLTEIETTAGLLVTGTVTNAHFRQVTLDDLGQTQVVVDDGCEATLTEISFSAPVQTP